jgi:hypothetical protein
VQRFQGTDETDELVETPTCSHHSAESVSNSLNIRAESYVTWWCSQWKDWTSSQVLAPDSAATSDGNVEAPSEAGTTSTMDEDDDLKYYDKEYFDPLDRMATSRRHDSH